MPSTLPSSFASAAAGTNSDSQSRAGHARGDAAALADWTRRPNGATQTFRRSSSAINVASAAHSRDASTTTPSASAYVPPHISQARNGFVTDTRYSRMQLLELYNDQRADDDLDNGLAELFVGEGDSSYANGAASSGKWSRRDDLQGDVAPGAEICFTSGVGAIPSGLIDMTDEEKENFVASVNSTVKAPTQSTNAREAQANRRISLSTGSQALGSPTSTRPSNRRRETGDSQLVMSPKAGRDDGAPSSPPPSLIRRRTDLRDDADARAKESGVTPAGTSGPIGSLRRSSTQPFQNTVTSPSSPWATGPPASGMGSFGNFSMSTSARPGLGPRGESRFRGLMSRESAEEMAGKSSLSGLGRVNETRRADDDEAYPAEGAAIGSAALGGDSPPPGAAFPDPVSQRQKQGLGQSLPGLGGVLDAAGFPGGDYLSHPPSQPQQLHRMSPTRSNPYTSPDHIKGGGDEAELEGASDSSQFHFPGLGGFRQDSSGNPNAFNARMATAFGDSQAFDRNPASAMGSHGFPGLGGLSGLGGLGATEASLRSPATMQSPSLAGLGGNAFSQAPSNASQSGSIGRGSRLGSLFPSAMQDQMRGARGVDAQSEDADEQFGSFGNIGGFGHGSIVRDTESPFRSGRGKFEDFFPTGDKGQDSQDPFSRAQAPGSSGVARTPGQQPPGPQRMASSVGGISGQPPAPQQKQMVMPDRIRWIYRDPQGNTQGPWSGLEMHDWYRAGFFSPELLVKKVEDGDYEPLAQLIRRIGNSREPFLVPQIGIPGPPSSQSGSWPNQPAVAPPPSAGAPGTQPPFAGSFPSFGTTLTAEQQNALERRKQEEQYLMARQKEHLAQQQLMVKQMQLSGSGFHSGQNLNHHSSANSLQSQPSYGSITSPTGYQASPMMGPGPLSQGLHGHGEHSQFRSGIGAIGSGPELLSHIKEEELAEMMERLGVTNEGQLAELQRPHHQGARDGTGRSGLPTSAAFAERARLRQEAALEEERERQLLEEAHGDDRRLQQFRHLQQGEYKHEDELSQEPHEDDEDDEDDQLPHVLSEERAAERDLTLTEQVQKAASAKQSPAPGSAGWTSKIETELPPSGVPAPSSSPLPAPAAQRKHGNMADQLNVDSVGPSTSPSVETPTASSIAPWAKDRGETQKQPSLKEIQEAEARRAAKQEEIHQQARRAALEREIASNQALAAAASSGLPSSSTWGTSSAEPSPITTNAPWAKLTGGKATPVSGSKKTLQQIQREEEVRKNKALAAAVQNSSMAAASASGVGGASKRYAELAGKSDAAGSPAIAAAANQVGGSGAWTTVGASGKPKPPPAPTPTGSAAPPAGQRVASGTLSRSVSSSAMATKPAAPVRTNTTVQTTASAMQSLQKWAIGELRSDLAKKGIAAEEFVETLLALGTDTGIITEAVHINSQTIDSRHFAEEFVRRRGLADKGKTVEAAGAGSGGGGGGSAGGWSEVARKGPAKTTLSAPEDSMFKVVAGKKKTGRK